jgi:hypothetical protein
MFIGKRVLRIVGVKTQLLQAGFSRLEWTTVATPVAQAEK